MRYLIGRYAQLATVPLMKIVNRIIIKQSNVQLNKSDLQSLLRYIIVCNHHGAIDAPIVCYSLPFSVQWIQARYVFMMGNRFFKGRLLNPIVITWGCFPAKRHEKYPYGLKHAISLIEDGQTVVVFPEGKVGSLDRQHAPKRGVEVLANITNVRLIPARVRWNRKKGLWKGYSLAVGKPFNAKNMTAEQIMDVVYSLKFR